MTRIEAAAMASYAYNDSYPADMAVKLWEKEDDTYRGAFVEDAKVALAAADAHDAAHGIHRVSLDDATVERAAVALYVHNNPVGNWSAHSARVKTPYRDAARAVLAAAEAGQ